jgi:hypothetical protein
MFDYSLYPWVCKYGKFPIGHPEIITENFLPLDQQPYYGLIKARVVVPADLLHPVLPYRSKGKLLFPNCRTCADNRSEQDCVHTETERAIEGVWASCELYRAMEKGVLNLILSIFINVTYLTNIYKLQGVLC